MTDTANQHEHMKDSVAEADTLEAIQDGTNRVGKSANGESCHTAGRQTLPHRANEKNHHPSHQDIHRS